MVPGILLLAAAVTAWLSVVDRTSPLALALVELEGRLGQPLWMPLAVAGAAALAVRVLRHASRTARPSLPPPNRDIARMAARAASSPAIPAAPGGATWADAVRAQARALPVEPIGRVRLDDAPGVPFTLTLTSATPEQARRRLAVFAEFLAAIPTPPAARVRVVSSPDLEGPLHRLLGAELGRHFPAGACHVASVADGVDVRFARPDPRWREG